MSSKQKPDEEAARAREAERKAQQAEADKLKDEQARRDDLRRRRGEGISAFTRTSGEQGILSPTLGA